MVATDDFFMMTTGQVVLVTDDLDEARDRFGSAFGLHADDDVPGTTRLHRDRINLRVITARPSDPAAADYLRAHGPGVAVIGLRVPDRARALDQAVRNGAVTVEDYPGREFYGVPAVATPAGYVHAFTEAAAPPDRRAAEVARPPVWDSGLMTMDHFAVCVPSGELDDVVAFYENVLGFTMTFKERVRVGRQGMNSMVVEAPTRDVTFTVIEPDPDREPGQIDAFLEQHGGPGVQHIAFLCSDAVRTVRGLRARGVDFLPTPSAYYDQLPERLGALVHAADALRGEHILVDEDHGGQLYQIFTRSRHPRGTLFYEVIERVGASTFGSGNIAALYAAVEADGRDPA